MELLIENFEFKLLKLYRDNEYITINYRKSKLINEISGYLTQVDLINRLIYLNNVKIKFKSIIEIKE